MTPTDEQLAIMEFAKTQTPSLLISALAGAAKTTTLELLCKALPVQPILSLAFNKKIAEEMKRRLPGHVTCKTMNALGHGVWSAATGKRLVVDTRKSYGLLKQAVDVLPRHMKVDAYDTFSETLKVISQAKLQGYVPPEGPAHATRLVGREEFLEGLDEPIGGLQQRLLDTVLLNSIVQSYAGTIDFDDQIYMPTLFGGTFPRFPLVMVDEAQDLSPLNHAMLKKLVTTRLIAVGDQWQSIYAFRGAVTSSMALLQDTFNMQEMTLSVSFRCPRRVVERARFRAPHMQWAPGAADGTVQSMETWDAQSIPDGAAIICRNNAPLFKCALSLLRSGRGVHCVGADIGPGLVRILKKLGPPEMIKEIALDEIAKWEVATAAKARAKGSIHDKADCLRVFVSYGSNLRDAIAYAEGLFKQSGPIILLSGHKAKGLEWPTVYHLDPHRIPSPWATTPEEIEQELNIKYVILTRAKREYFEVTMEGFANGHQ